MSINLPFGMKTPAEQASAAAPPAPPDAGFDPSAQSGPQSFRPSQNMQQWQDPSNYQDAPYDPAATSGPESFRSKPLPNPYTRPDLNRRVYSMIAAGAHWLPLQTLYGLADSGLADDEVLQLSETLRHLAIDGVRASAVQPGVAPAKAGVQYQQEANKAVSSYSGVLDAGPGITAAAHGTAAVSTADQWIKKADDGFKHFQDDPVLQKHPSAGMVVQSYLSNVLGPAQVAGGGTLKHAQQQIQLLGYGRDLPADGVMSSGWSSAMAEYKNGVFRSQLAGNRPGALSVDHVVKALSAITPAEAWPALWNYLSHAGDGIKQMVGDVAGSYAGLTAGMLQSATQGNLDFLTKKEGTPWQRAAHGEVASTIQNIGSDTQQTPEQNVGDFQKNFGAHLLEDGLNAIMLSSITSAGSRFWDAVGMEKLASSSPEAGAALTKDAAFRGPGVLAKSLSSEVPGTAVWEHLPILKNIGPVVNDLAAPASEVGSEGASALRGQYYAMRSFTHQPWTWVSGQEGVSGLQGAIGTGLRLGDVGFQKSLLLGAEARGIGQIDQTLTGDNNAPLAKHLNDNTPIDELNDAIKSFNIAGTHPLSLDDLMFVFGGQGAAALHNTTSDTIGRTASSMQQAMVRALHEVGTSGAVSRLYDGKSIERISKEFGGSDNFATFIWGKIYDEAAKFGAQNEFDRKLAEDGLPQVLSSSERTGQIRARTAEIRNDPQQVHTALNSLLSQGGGNELFVRLQHDKILDEASWAPETVLPRIEASHHVRDNILPWIDTTVPDGSKVFPQGGDPSTFGIIPKDVKTVQEAHEFNTAMEAELASIRAREAYNPDAYQFAQRQTSVGEEHLNPATPSPGPKPTPAEILDWNNRMGDHLYQTYGIDHQMMPQRWEDKVKISKQLADDHLPVKLIPHPDAPPAVEAAIQKLDDMGYKLVNVKDIGHKIQDVGPMEDLHGGLTFRRRLVESIGLNPDNISDSTIGQSAQNQILIQLKKLQDEQGVQLGTGQTPASTLQFLRSHGVLPEGDILKGKIAEFLGTNTRLQKLLQSDVEALQTQLPLRDAARTNIRDALMDPEMRVGRDDANYDMFHAQLTANNVGEIPPWMSERDANLVAHAIVKGYSKVPTSFTGLNHIEDMFRGLGFMGLGMENKLGYAMANLPNKLIQMRNQIRFDISPMFDLRRVFKTNIKMATMGIPPTWDPIKALVDGGAWEEARDILAKTRPSQFRAEALGYADTADRYLASQGVFHYNQLGYETWAAYHLHQDGMSLPEIDNNLTKLFQYGDRTGMERSMNFLFFPFSFEKSLYKVMGTYILDKPAQRLLLTQGIAAYDQFNKEHMDGSNPLATSFYTKHMPLLTEASRLNAFTQGISLGEPGGINRPLLNLFLPQSWYPSGQSQSLLERFVPVIKDFQRIYSESLEQGHITRDWADNLYQDYSPFGDRQKATLAEPRKSTLSANEDLSAGFDMYRQLTTKYHDHIVNGDIIPVSPEWGQFSGKPLTNQIIRELVHRAHPAYTATGAATYVIENNQKFDEYLDTLRGTPGNDGKFHGAAKLDDGTPAYAYVKSFREAVNQLGSDLQNADKPADLAGQTDDLRKAAQYLAEHDSAFYKLYPKTFGRILGPLEAVTK